MTLREQAIEAIKDRLNHTYTDEDTWLEQLSEAALDGLLAWLRESDWLWRDLAIRDGLTADDIKGDPYEEWWAPYSQLYGSSVSALADLLSADE